MIVALGGVGQNARAAAGAWIADVVPGDLVVTSIRPIAADEGRRRATSRIGRRASPASARSPRSMSPSTGCRIDGAAVVGRGPRRRRPARRSSPATGPRRWPRSTPVARPSSRRRSPTGSGSDRRRRRHGPDRRRSATWTWRSSGSSSARIPGTAGEAMLVGWTDATDRLGVAGADVFAVRFAPNAPDAAQDALCGHGRRARPRGRHRSTRSRAPSATRSAGSSACSMRSPSSPSSSPRSGSSTR